MRMVSSVPRLKGGAVGKFTHARCMQDWIDGKFLRMLLLQWVFEGHFRLQENVDFADTSGLQCCSQVVSSLHASWGLYVGDA